MDSDHSWIMTFSGKRFYPLAPRIEDIDIVDIAHALSNICRFTGHVRSFYSVAQHSVLCAQYAPDRLKLALLLHDASEAYLCDVARPVKHAPGMAPYRAAEQHLQTLIGQRFGVSFEDSIIHDIDNRMLMTERRDLMDCTQTWSVGNLAPYPEPIRPMQPAQAELALLWALETAMRPGNKKAP